MAGENTPGYTHGMGGSPVMGGSTVMGVSLDRWMAYFMENPSINGFRGISISGNLHII